MNYEIKCINGTVLMTAAQHHTVCLGNFSPGGLLGRLYASQCLCPAHQGLNISERVNCLLYIVNIV